MKWFAYLFLFTSFCKSSPTKEVPPIYMITCFSGAQVIFQNFGLEAQYYSTYGWNWRSPDRTRKVQTSVTCTAMEVTPEEVPTQVLEEVMDSQ